MPTHDQEPALGGHVGQPLVIASVGLALGVFAAGAGAGAAYVHVVPTIHCSVSSEPSAGAVENALGLLFGILILFRIRAARRRARADQRDSEAPNGRLPYRDIGLRESLASISDDRL